MNGEESVEILLVDDREQDRELVRQWLRSAGYGASCASDAADALRMLRDHDYAVLVTDLHMPEMDGLMLARKAREILHDVSVILCTGDCSPSLAETARKAGVAAVFTKPLSLCEIMGAITAELEKQRTRRKLDTFPHWGVWTCPDCLTRHMGWSPINICSRCGCRG